MADAPRATAGPTPSVNPVAVEVRNVSFSYGDRRALDGVSFDVGIGEICGLLGPNGSGKSTLFRILTTLLRPQAGTARVAGDDVAADPDRVRASIGVAFQSPALDRRLTVVENLRHRGRLYGLRGRALRERIDEALERAGLRERADDLAGTLSGGLQRRVELAMGLLHRPAVLILDEPGTGLDPAARRAFRGELRRLRDEGGVTVLLTTHLMDEADACDRIVILDGGRVVAVDTPERLRGQIAGECVVIRARDLDGLSARIAERFDVRPVRVDDTLRIEHPRGHELIPRLIEAYGAGIDSVSVARPTLEDVFIQRTGHRLAPEEVR